MPPPPGDARSHRAPDLRRGSPVNTTTERRRIPGRYWKLATLSGMASYLDSGIIVSVGVSLAIWGEHFDMSVWMLGSISAVLTACIAVGSLVGGRLADM